MRRGLRLSEALETPASKESPRELASPRRQPLNTYHVADLKTELDLIQKFSLGHRFGYTSPQTGVCKHECVAALTLPVISLVAVRTIVTDLSPPV